MSRASASSARPSSRSGEWRHAIPWPLDADGLASRVHPLAAMLLLPRKRIARGCRQHGLALVLALVATACSDETVEPDASGAPDAAVADAGRADAGPADANPRALSAQGLYV